MEAGHWPDCMEAREDGGPNTAGPSAAGPNVRWPENTNQPNPNNSTDGNCAGNVTRSRDQHMCRVIQSVTPALYSKANTIS